MLGLGQQILGARVVDIVVKLVFVPPVPPVVVVVLIVPVRCVVKAHAVQHTKAEQYDWKATV
mgnify:CR=1 FL=1